MCLEEDVNQDELVRIIQSQLFIKNSLVVEALEIIYKSNNVEDWVVQKAAYLLEKE